jgi:hypothetical protein
VSEEKQAIDYLAMAQFLKSRGYSISGETAYFPGGLSAVCLDEDDAYLMALGHFLAWNLGRKWKALYEMWWQVENAFSEEEGAAIFTAIHFYEALET